MTNHSDLDRIIPPEIKEDELYYLIIKLVGTSKVKTVLEIGSSAGGGSTEAFVSGLKNNPNNPMLFCMEVSMSRFAKLQQTYAHESFVKCYNMSSVSLVDFPSEEEIVDFYKSNRSVLNRYPLERVLGWLRQDVEYIKNSGVAENGIDLIKRENNIRTFDMVLIDGSEFTGIAELDLVYGSRFILLDDINAYKNCNNFKRLEVDPQYKLIHFNRGLRNGYAIFERIGERKHAESNRFSDDRDLESLIDLAKKYIVQGRQPVALRYFRKMKKLSMP